MDDEFYIAEACTWIGTAKYSLDEYSITPSLLTTSASSNRVQISREEYSLTFDSDLT